MQQRTSSVGFAAPDTTQQAAAREDLSKSEPERWDHGQHLRLGYILCVMVPGLLPPPGLHCVCDGAWATTSAWATSSANSNGRSASLSIVEFTCPLSACSRSS